MTIKKYAGDKITGLSSDTKPTNVPEGATFHELDTGRIYHRYSSAWSEIEQSKISAAYDAANLAYTQANTARTQGNTAYTQANTAFDVANSSYDQANTARTHANSAYATANIALPNTSGVTFAGNLNVSQILTANNLVSSNGYIDLGPGSRPAYLEGRIYYDNIDKSLTVHNDTTFTFPIGQIDYARVWNESGSTLPKGAPVYATGFHNLSHHHFTVDLADASDPLKYDVIGLVAADIPDASHGYVIVRGWIGGINTASLTAGSRFHLGYASPGSLVTTAPEYPNYPFDVGYCTVSNTTNGYLYVDRQSHSFESLRILQSARIGGDFFVEGDFTVLGSQSSVAVESMSVGTQFIYVGAGDSIPTANINFTGSGLDDLEFKGHFASSGTKTFYVKITATSPDKFSWSYLSDFSTLQQENVAIQFQTTQALANGIGVYFNANTGHTLNDKWDATVTGVSTDFGFIGNHVDGPNGYTHAGLFRDASDGTFKFFRSYDAEITTTVDIANTTYNLANVQVDRVTAVSVYEGATKLSDSIGSSYDQANTARIHANVSYAQANTARDHANVAYDQANTARTQGNTAYTQANDAYTQANTALTSIGVAYDQANTARNHANVAYAQANSAYDKANSTTYTANVVISVADNSNAALRITQTGGAEAFRVEDDTNPDASPFVITATGNVGIGTASPQVPLQSNGMLLIVLNNSTPLLASGEMAEFVHSVNSYAQFHVRNANNGIFASGDIVVTTDTGTDTDEYIDLGVNSSTYNEPSWTINGAKDGYLIMKGGNLAIGTGNTIAMKTIDFFTMGPSATELVMSMANGVSIGYPKSDPGANNLSVVGFATVASMNVVPTVQVSYNQANTARDHANVAFAKANTVNVRSTPPLNIYVGTTAPTGNSVGDIWIDTN
jgi:hypothetical protein